MSTKVTNAATFSMFGEEVAATEDIHAFWLRARNLDTNEMSTRVTNQVSFSVFREEMVAAEVLHDFWLKTRNTSI